MKFVLAVVMALCLSQLVNAQEPIYVPGQMMQGTYQPTTVVNQTVAPSMNHGVPPIHLWNQGVREEWRTIHETRPVRDYDDPRYQGYQRNYQPSYQQPSVYQPSYQQPSMPLGGGWYTVGPQYGNGYCYPTYQRQSYCR